jgi:hypothetical protein
MFTARAIIKFAAVSTLAAGLSTAASAAPAKAAPAKCTSVQARCAIEVGGTCDPVTNRWHSQCTNDACSQRFNACISRLMGGGKK